MLTVPLKWSNFCKNKVYMTSKKYNLYSQTYFFKKRVEAIERIFRLFGKLLTHMYSVPDTAAVGHGHPSHTGLFSAKTTAPTPILSAPLPTWQKSPPWTCSSTVPWGLDPNTPRLPSTHQHQQGPLPAHDGEAALEPIPRARCLGRARPLQGSAPTSLQAFWAQLLQCLAPEARTSKAPTTCPGTVPHVMPGWPTEHLLWCPQDSWAQWENLH